MLQNQLFIRHLILIKSKGKQEDPLDAFTEAIKAVEPKIEVKSRRVGGATYQVPVDVEENRANVLAIRWILDSVSKRKRKNSFRKIFLKLWIY